ncbi:two-component sensor histidine kinase [Lactobacillus nasalidis]|uniref:histidine kinase n=1 Tax=Lactobacillus nasalidis TaxID=2797258 RepID=A0ABQ3W7H4_9LACO|nr:HAMP domain-containing sensor histidine kinase [Lactobacillus nasalidis]GHV96989.1 two-component sensor histidine kinase [Lactobacillus nasalidis]GHV99013.1 two-component sensor histidine kinase [Lactobacillus nasalidis]GHW02038.1 two-component sensor histidine kinase [Lactobacillus nasalidis]
MKNSNSAILLRNLLALTTILTFLFGLLTMLAVVQQELANSSANTRTIVRRLKGAVIDDDQDWRNWQVNNGLSSNLTYVHVENRRADAKRKNYYSANAKQLTRSLKPLPFFGGIYYRGDALYAYASGHSRGIYYQVWVNLHQQKQVVKNVLLTILIVWIIVLAISVLFAVLLSDKLTQPLLVLNLAAKKAADSGRGQLPVPEKPTEIKELAVSFNELLGQLYDQNEQEKSFVNNAAHELRTPIAAIRSNAQLIKRRGGEHPEVIPEAVAFIDDESRHMQKMVDELLTLARTDRRQLEKAAFNLKEALQSALKSAQLAQPVQLACPDGLELVSDRDCLIEIVLNLLTNAGKYSPASSQVLVKAEATDGGVRISVADQGQGISAKDKEHVFDYFYRSDEVRGQIPGTGLGLAIAQKMAALLGGTLALADNQPQGTIFTLTLKQERAK